MNNYKTKYLKYQNMINNMNGGIASSDEIFLICGHGKTSTNPLNFFSVPGNIRIIPYSTCGNVAIFDEAEINKESRKKYVMEQERVPERLYSGGSLFPDMKIQMNMEYVQKSTGKKYFSYTGIISDDYREFTNFVQEEGKIGKYFGWYDAYTNPAGKVVNQKSLELHRQDIFPIKYNEIYNLSDLIYAIAKKIQKIPGASYAYVFVSSCRGIDEK